MYRAPCHHCNRTALLLELSPNTSPWAASDFGWLCPGCFVKHLRACRQIVRQDDPLLFEKLTRDDDVLRLAAFRHHPLQGNPT